MGDEENNCLMIGASAARSENGSAGGLCGVFKHLLTLTSCTLRVYAGTSHQNVMNDGENTFAAYPEIPLALYPTVVQDCGFVQLNTPPVDGLSKRYFLRMEIFPARSTDHLFRTIAKDVGNRARCIEYTGVKRQIWGILAPWTKTASYKPAYRVWL